MYRFLLQPRWLAVHVGALLAVAAFVSLGAWQWDRARTRDSGPPPTAPALGTARPLAEVVGAQNLVTPDNRGAAVTVTGRYDLAHQLLSPGHDLKGQAGFYVVTPLVTSEGPAATVVRGWVPGREQPAAAVPVPPSGQVTVRGYLAPSETPLPAGMPGVLPAGQVERVTTADLVNRWPYRLYDGSVLLADQQPPTTPALATVPPPLPPAVTHWSVQSLTYALQWWLFAGATVWMWAAAVRKEAAIASGGGSGGVAGGAVGGAPSAAGPGELLFDDPVLDEEDGERDRSGQHDQQHLEQRPAAAGPEVERRDDVQDVQVAVQHPDDVDHAR
jgi:cytochrome oxidase assembly protein ShyY1